MKKILWVLIFAVTTALPVLAIPYNAGNYVVDVEVRNSAQNVIPQAKVSCYLSGKNIHVEARATGYKSTHILFPPNGNQGYYKRDLVLMDPELEITVADINGKPIVSSYVDRAQFGFDPREFGLWVHVPIKEWQNPSSKNVQVYDDYWGVTIKSGSAIDQVDEFQRVRLTITRKAVSWSGGHYYVLLKAGKPASAGRVQEMLAKLHRAEVSGKVPGDLLESTADFLADTMSREEMDSVLAKEPSLALQTRIQEEDRFEALHHPVPEKLSTLLRSSGECAIK